MTFPTFKSKDEIPEPFLSVYEERDGAWHPKVEDTSALKAKNAELLTETKAERKKRQEAEAKIAEIESEREAKAAGLTAEKLAEITAKAEARFAPKLAELEQARKELRALKLDSAVKGLFAKADVIDPDAAWKIAGEEYDLTDDGKAILKSDPTADIEKHITGTMRQKYPYLFKGTQAAGGGAAGSTGAGTGGGAQKPVTQWSSEERASYMEQHGVEALQSLRDQQLRESVTKGKAA